MWVPIRDLMRLLDVSYPTAARLAHSLPSRWVRLRPGKHFLVHQEAVDALQLLADQPARELSPRESDWLSRYLEGEPSARRPQPGTGTPGSS